MLPPPSSQLEGSDCDDDAGNAIICRVLLKPQLAPHARQATKQVE